MELLGLFSIVNVGTNGLQFARSKHVRGKVIQALHKTGLPSFPLEKKYKPTLKFRKIDLKGLCQTTRITSTAIPKIAKPTSLLYKNNLPMRTRKNTLPLLLLLSLLSLTLSQTPPHVHKLPLQLTSNYVYYADLYFGSDQQNITVLVDTGSRTLAAFCSLCRQGCLP